MRLQRIIDLRTDNDMSSSKLAKEIGISDRVLRYYEKGEHNIPLEVLILIADYFHVSTDYLLERTSKKEINRWKLAIP